MNRIFATHEQLAQRVGTRAEGYAELIAQAVVEKTAEGAWYDRDHAAWKQAVELYRPRQEAVERMPCGGCGGGNAVTAAAMARTPAELERAILEA